MSRAASHHSGRRLTGFTFGKRGAPAYARVYDKTREADPDALIREHWSNVLERDLGEKESVWRVEFELRPEFLRSLADGDEHISTTPRVVLAEHLDAIWEHLTQSWLVLRQRGRSRKSRCAPQPWWEALSKTAGQDAGRTTLRRLPRTSRDPAPLLRQIAGTLAAFGARRQEQSLAACLEALVAHMNAAGGEPAFALAVERAALRLPLAARTREDAERRRQDDGRLRPEFPSHEPLTPCK